MDATERKVVRASSIARSWCASRSAALGDPMAANSTRDLVTRLAPTDPEGAARLARTIDEPWFRSQALAWAARFAADDRVEPLAEEALIASYAESDPYRTVGSGAWAIRALVERGRPVPARRVLADLLVLAPEAEPTASRAEALFLVWQAAFALGRDARRKILDMLLTTCQGSDSWRVGRVFQDIAWMLGASDHEMVQRILAAMPEGRWKRQAKRRLAAAESLKPRPFF